MKKENQTWAYCHGELSAEERAAFERECKKDPELMRQCKEATWLDGCLRNAYESEAIDDKPLTESILEEMKKSGELEGVFAHPSESRPARKHSFRRLFSWTSLATAAGIVAMLSWWPQPSGRLQFSENLRAVAIRRGINEHGEEISEPIFTHCTVGEVNALLARLQESIVARYGQQNRRPLLVQWLSPDEPVKLQLVFQELRAGKVFLEIHCESHAEEDHSWNRYYPSLDDCLREIDELAEEAVQGLTALSEK